jgi:5-methylcytosine-specific restriction endonuclease McrA
MTYAEQLKHPLWLAKRQWIIQEANYRCEDCGQPESQGGLEVHHCFYITGQMAWVYERDLLIALCPKCHDFRQKREQGQQIIFARVMRQMTPLELDDAFWTFLAHTAPMPWREAR